MNAPDSNRTGRTWKALGEVAGHPVVAAWRDQARKARPSRRVPWAIAAAVVLSLAAAIVYGLFADREADGTLAAAGGPQSFVTARGELRKVMLPDGSRLTLNTSSRVQVNYRGEARRLQLIEGEALFEVARDPQRPFIVTAAQRQVVALGTAFNVRLDDAAVQVTLLEGRVSVGASSASAAVELAPGQQLTAAPDAEPVVGVADVARIAGWQSGWLIFDRDTVGEAVGEFSRYTSERIVCDDARLARLHVSGTFRAGEVDGFLDALKQIHPFTVERPQPGELRLVWRER